MGKLDDIDVVVCDLDGVVWLAHEEIDGSVEAVSHLKGFGKRVIFATNNSFSRRAEQVSTLERMGIPAQGCVATSAMAAAALLEPGWRVLVCGGEGLVEEVRLVTSEVHVCHEDPAVTGRFDAVVTGMHRQFDYSVLARAARAVHEGALLVGSNSDSTYPTPDGLLPGGGSILAAVSTASGAAPLVAGKPHPPMADLVRAMCGDTDPSRILVVGDRADTDGLFASELGAKFGLVLSGVTRSPEGVSCDEIAPTLRELVRALV